MLSYTEYVKTVCNKKKFAILVGIIPTKEVFEKDALLFMGDMIYLEFEDDINMVILKQVREEVDHLLTLNIVKEDRR